MSLVIITFNIGGKQYQVSKQLLNKYPISMLYTVSVEIEASNNDTPIFIDGNSDRFPYILDYMKYKKVELPFNIGKESFLQDLDYYGFEDIQLKDIVTLSERQSCKERLELVVSRIVCDRLFINRYLSSCTYGPNCAAPSGASNCLKEIELGLYILWDSKHEEHEYYCTTLTSMLSKHNVSIEWIKNQKDASVWMSRNNVCKIHTR